MRVCWRQRLQQPHKHEVEAREEALGSQKEALAFFSTLWWAAVLPASPSPYPLGCPVVQVKSQPYTDWDEKER